jgi:hypothetical protein
MTASREELIARLNERAMYPVCNDMDATLQKLLREAAAALQSQQPAPANLGPVRELVRSWHELAAMYGDQDLADRTTECANELTTALSQCEAGGVDDAMVNKAHADACDCFGGAYFDALDYMREHLLAALRNGEGA